MIRARVRRLAATAAIGSLLAIQAFAGSAGAAVPEADVPSEAIPPTYTAGEAAGFRGSFQLDPTESGTLSKLFLRINVDESLADNVFFGVSKNGIAVSGNPCKLDAPANPEDVVCTLKTVRPTDKIVAIAGYLAINGATEIHAQFIWGSVGVPQNDDQSHGDSWLGDPLVATENAGTNVNYGGGFTWSGDITVINGPIGLNNPQQARLLGLPVGVAATVQDGLTEGPCVDTFDVDCDNVSGEWVEVVVGDGLTYPLFRIEIQYSEQGAPKGFVHTFENANGDTVQELIGPCAKKNPTYPCFTWSNPTNTATIFTTHNGSYVKIR